MTTSHTPRGFAVYAEFTDTYGSEVKVQQSSSASGPRVWIFANHPSIRGHLSLDVQGRLLTAGFRTDLHLAELGAALEPSPHLNVEQARQVRDALDTFIRENSEEGQRHG